MHRWMSGWVGWMSDGQRDGVRGRDWGPSKKNRGAALNCFFWVWWV